MLGPPINGADVYNYLGYARLQALHGLNPYAHSLLAAPRDQLFAWTTWHQLSDPYGPGFTLVVAPLGHASIQGVACPSTSQCTAVGGMDQVTFNPSAPGTPTPTKVDSGTFAFLFGVACPSTSQCTAVDGAGQEVTFNPSAPGTPTPTTIDATNRLSGVACPSTSQCTAVDIPGPGRPSAPGQEVTFDPSAPGTPSPTTIDGGQALYGVACPSVSKCVAVDRSGRAVEGDPANPNGFTVEPIAGANALMAVSCSSMAQCVTVDSVGHGFVGSVASGGGGGSGSGGGGSGSGGGGSGSGGGGSGSGGGGSGSGGGGSGTGPGVGGIIPGITRPPVLPRANLPGLRLSARRVVRGGRTVFIVRGSLRLPPSIPVSKRALVCRGLVSVAAGRGHKTAGSRTVGLGRDCSFSLRIVVPTSKLGRKGRYTSAGAFTATFTSMPARRPPTSASRVPSRAEVAGASAPVTGWAGGSRDA